MISTSYEVFGGFQGALLVFSQQLGVRTISYVDFVGDALDHLVDLGPCLLWDSSGIITLDQIINVHFPVRVIKAGLCLNHDLVHVELPVELAVYCTGLGGHTLFELVAHLPLASRQCGSLRTEFRILEPPQILEAFALQYSNSIKHGTLGGWIGDRLISFALRAHFNLLEVRRLVEQTCIISLRHPAIFGNVPVKHTSLVVPSNIVCSSI